MTMKEIDEIVDRFIITILAPISIVVLLLLALGVR